MIYNDDISSLSLISLVDSFKTKQCHHCKEIISEPYKHTICPKDIQCNSWEHKLWKCLIDGDFDMIFDPATENPGTAFDPDVLRACLEIEKNLFDMAHGLSNYSKIISHIHDALRRRWFVLLDGSLCCGLGPINSMHSVQNMHPGYANISSTIQISHSGVSLGSRSSYKSCEWCCSRQN